MARKSLFNLLFLLIAINAHATTFYLKTGVASGTFPSVTQQTTDTVSFDTYFSARDLKVNQDAGTYSTAIGTYIDGVDNNTYYGESKGWGTVALGKGTVSGAWKIITYPYVDGTDGGIIISNVKYALFRINSAGVKQEQIGTTQTASLSTSPTLSTLTFSASQSVTFADNDRLYLEAYMKIRDRATGSGVMITTYQSNNSSTQVSYIITPGLLSPFGSPASNISINNGIIAHGTLGGP